MLGCEPRPVVLKGDPLFFLLCSSVLVLLELGAPVRLPVPETA